MGGSHGRILRIVAACAALGGGPSRAAFAAGPARRSAEIAELKTYLAEKETVLKQLNAEYAAKLREADALARDVEAQKEKADRSWFEQRSIEKNLARLRFMYDDIEKLAARRLDVRQDAWACAGAIVGDLEDELSDGLDRLRAADTPAERTRLVERVRGLEDDRRVHQRKMNELAPDVPVPGELPRGVAWTGEMVEDQRRAYEAAVARLQIERGELAQQRELHRLVGASLSRTAPGGPADGAEADLRGRIAGIDIRLERLQEKLRALPATARLSATAGAD